MIYLISINIIRKHKHSGFIGSLLDRHKISPNATLFGSILHGMLYTTLVTMFALGVRQRPILHNNSLTKITLFFYSASHNMALLFTNLSFYDKHRSSKVTSIVLTESSLMFKGGNILKRINIS